MSNNWSCSLYSTLLLAISKVSSSLKTTIHEAFIFLYHINKIHTQTNHLAVTAKILSQPSIQFCVASVAVQMWQTDCHWLHETSLPCSTFTSHQNTDHTVIHQMRKTYQLHYGAVTGHPARICVFSNRRHCFVCACSATVWL